MREDVFVCVSLSLSECVWDVRVVCCVCCVRLFVRVWFVCCVRLCARVFVCVREDVFVCVSLSLSEYVWCVCVLCACVSV